MVAPTFLSYLQSLLQLTPHVHAPLFFHPLMCNLCTHNTGGVFCDSSMTMSPVNGDYRWEQTIAGGTATQPCVFGSAVGGLARRQCGVDAVWREPDFTECINSECNIQKSSGMIISFGCHLCLAILKP